MHNRVLRAGAAFLVERVDVREEDTLEVRIRAEGFASLVAHYTSVTEIVEAERIGKS